MLYTWWRHSPEVASCTKLMLSWWFAIKDVLSPNGICHEMDIIWAGTCRKCVKTVPVWEKAPWYWRKRLLALHMANPSQLSDSSSNLISFNYIDKLWNTWVHNFKSLTMIDHWLSLLHRPCIAKWLNYTGCCILSSYYIMIGNQWQSMAMNQFGWVVLGRTFFLFLHTSDGVSGRVKYYVFSFFFYSPLLSSSV